MLCTFQIQWIPINFIRNPWYDDQWDISKDSLLLGKTFTMVSRHEKGFLGTSYTLIGHGLHEKFDDGIKLMSEWIKSADKPSVAREAVSRQSLLSSSISDACTDWQCTDNNVVFKALS